MPSGGSTESNLDRRKTPIYRIARAVLGTGINLEIFDLP
jgi:hypothetical protein